MTSAVAGAGHFRISLAATVRRLGDFAALWFGAACLLPLAMAAAWFGVGALPGGAPVAAAIVAGLAVLAARSSSRRLFAHPCLADLAAAMTAAMIVLGAEVAHGLPAFFMLSFALAMVADCWIRSRSGIAGLAIVAMAFLAVIGGASWQLAFTISDSCLEDRAERATYGEHPGGTCRTYSYDRLIVTTNAGTRTAWFEGNAPPEPGTLDAWVNRGIAHSPDGLPTCPGEATLGTCDVEPLGDDWYEYRYSTAVWA